MSITTVTAIIKDCCEAEPSDPDHPDTICISVSDLEIIVARNLEVVILSDDPLPRHLLPPLRRESRSSITTGADMSDITMCKGQDCLLRESCYRYTAPANPYRQSYFLTGPLDEIGDCKEWVDNGKEQQP